MNKLLVFLKGSHLHKTVFPEIKDLYPAIGLSTKSKSTLEKALLQVRNQILNATEPLHIIGFGDYSLKINYIRIELSCTNLFRNKIIGEKESYKLNSYFKKFGNIRRELYLLKSKGIGKNYCNIFCYELCRLIENNKECIKTDIYFDFLHIPKSLSDSKLIIDLLEGTLTHKLV